MVLGLKKMSPKNSDDISIDHLINASGDAIKPPVALLTIARFENRIQTLARPAVQRQSRSVAARWGKAKDPFRHHL
jgi:hypothetical protein